MKSWAWAAICISIASAGALSGVAGCSSDDPAGDSDEDDGEGGSSDGGSGPGASGSGASGSGTGPASGSGTGPASSSGSAGGTCDDLPCTDSDMDVNNDCQSCALAGDETPDGGQCNPQLQECANTANDACFALNDCIAACPDPAVDEQAFLDCLCTNQDVNGEILCNEDLDPPTQSAAGTCFGDFPEGLEPFVALIDCVFGEVCVTACE